MDGYLRDRAWFYGARVAPRIQEVSMSNSPIALGTVVGQWREPSDGLSLELRRYARSEGLAAADLRRVRASDRRSAAAAIRGWVAGLRHPGGLVASRQH